MYLNFYNDYVYNYGRIPCYYVTAWRKVNDDGDDDACFNNLWLIMSFLGC